MLCPPGGGVSVFLWYNHRSRGVQFICGYLIYSRNDWMHLTFTGGKVEKNESVLNYLPIQGKKNKIKKEKRASLSSFWIFRHLMYTWRQQALKQAFNIWLIPVRIIILPLLSEALSWAEEESESCVNKIVKIIPKSVCFLSNHHLFTVPKWYFSLLQGHKWEDWNLNPHHQLWMDFQDYCGEEAGGKGYKLIYGSCEDLIL